MRIIDAHVHQWNVFANPDNVAKFLERNPEVDYLVLASNLTGGAYPSVEEMRASNDSTVEYVERFPRQVKGWCYVNPVYRGDALEELRRGFDRGLMGMKLWVATRCDDERVFPLVEACIEADRPLIVHTWKKATGNLARESTPMHLANLARRYPEARILMAHFGGFFEYGLKAVAPCRNVRVDYAGSVNERGAYEMAVRLLGEDRVIFGSDMPADFHTNLGRVLEADFLPGVRDKILAENFEAMLRPEDR